MSAPVLSLPLETLTRARWLVILSALVGLGLGGLALGLGISEGSVSLWGFGGAALLQVPLALGVRARIRDGLGNRGLDRERRTLRAISHLVRLLALGVLLASVAAWLGHRAPEAKLLLLGLATGSVALMALLGWMKRSLAPLHPTLALDAARTRLLLELAALALAGTMLGRWFPEADALTGIVMALRLFFEGRALAKLTGVQAACGGCGSGCGCG